MISSALGEEIIPTLRKLQSEIESLARAHAQTPLLARTHGQNAVPTTFGKEFKVFSARLERQIRQLEAMEIPAKLNGAVGNYNAHAAALPQVDWLKFSEDFISRLNAGRKIPLGVNLFTTQIEPHAGLAADHRNARDDRALNIPTASRPASLRLSKNIFFLLHWPNVCRTLSLSA